VLIAKYSELINDVLPSLNADPSDPVTEYAIKRACIDFCAGSWIWQYMPDPIDVEAGEAYYDLEPETGADVTVVMDVSHNNVPLQGKSIAWLDNNLPGWRTTRAVPKYYTQVDTDQIILAAVPDANIAAGLTMTLALQPSQAAVGLPKWIFTQYLYTLAAGAMARLMLMPNKPWTDLQNGAMHAANFQGAIANARASSLAALGRAAHRVTSQH
jgi:hypothetical protein